VFSPLSNPMEAVKPKYTYNPALQNLYRAVLHRLQHPDEPSLPPVPPARPPACPPPLMPGNHGRALLPPPPLMAGVGGRR
jgi:hypothetical protein